MARKSDTYDKPADRTSIRHAMQSIYYRSIGKSWELRGAPAVLLPPEARPMTIAEALGTLEASPPLWRDSIWRLARSVPSRPRNRMSQPYPPDLVTAVGADWLDALDDLRISYRTGANVFAAALEAVKDSDFDAAEDLMQILQKKTAKDAFGIDRAVQTVFGMTAQDMISYLTSGTRDNAEIARQLDVLEKRLGQDAHDFVMDFADSAAFQDASTELGRAQEGLVPGGITVYPVSTCISQDTATLTTTATVTTIVRGDLSVLATAFDPRNWQVASDVISKSGFVADPFSEIVPDESPLGTAFDSRLVRENATLSWGAGGGQQGSFDQVLNTSYTVRDEVEDPAARKLVLKFALRRSIKSRILWDERAGGLLLDGGSVRVNPVTDDTWRIVSRKVIRFSDRTPSVGGGLDAGQLVNYLAPAALAWWSETEIYKLESTKFLPMEVAA